MNIKSSTAIVFFPDGSGWKPRKYRKVTKRENLVKWLFNNFTVKPEKINWYDTKTKAFEETTHF